MPSKSEKQRRLMAAALAYKRGESSAVSDQVKQIARSMSEKELSDFASRVEEAIAIFNEMDKDSIDKDQEIKYKDDSGKEHTVKLGSALEYDKEHPGYKAAIKFIGGDKGFADKSVPRVGQPGRKPKSNIFNKAMQSLRSKQTSATSDMSSGLPKVPPSPTNYKGPSDDDKTISKKPGSAEKEREIVSMLNKLGEMANKARKGEGPNPPEYDLCEVSVPGTNLFCSGNLNIARQDMPQLKGTPSPGSLAAKLARKWEKFRGDNAMVKIVSKNDDGSIKEVDAERMFKMALAKRGQKLTKKRVPADQLRATQNQLVGAKVAGMMKALEADPDNKNIRAPIFVSKDGYILDGHHRWASIVGLQMANGSGEDIEMDVVEVDMEANDLVDFTNKFAEAIGIAQKKASAKKEWVAKKKAVHEAVETMTDLSDDIYSFTEDDADAILSNPSYVFKGFSASGYKYNDLKEGKYVPLSLVLDLSDSYAFNYITSADDALLSKLANGILKEEYIQEVVRKLKGADVWYLINWQQTSKFFREIIRDANQSEESVAQFFNEHVKPEVYRFWFSTDLHYKLQDASLWKDGTGKVDRLLTMINKGREVYAKKTLVAMKRSLKSYYDDLGLNWSPDELLSRMESE